MNDVKNENGENVPNLEITKVVLVHCNIVNNSYQQNSRAFYTFDLLGQLLDILFGQLLDILPKKFYIFKNILIQNFCILKYGLLTEILIL